MVGKVNVSPRKQPEPLPRRTTPVVWAPEPLPQGRAAAQRMDKDAPAPAAPTPPTAGFKIEKGIPLAPVRRVGRPSPYPFANMSVGDSFFVSMKGGDLKNGRGRLASAMGRARRDLRIKLKLRVVDGGVRIWRVG